MNIFVYENGPFMVNTYLVINEIDNRGIVIDPGDDMDDFVENIKKNNITVEAIVCTHGHIDHVAGVGLLKKHFDVLSYLNHLDKPIVDSIPMQARMFGVPDPKVPPFDKATVAAAKLLMRPNR